MGLKNFLKTKTSAFFAKRIDSEESLTHAADIIITEITALSKRYYQAENQISNLKSEIFNESARLEKRESQIKRAMEENNPNVTEIAKIGLTLRTIIEAKKANVKRLEEMKASLLAAGKELETQRNNLSYKLELIRETNRAKSMGINTESDVKELLGATTADVKDILMRVETFKGIGNDNSEASSLDLKDYLESLK